MVLGKESNWLQKNEKKIVTKKSTNIKSTGNEEGRWMRFTLRNILISDY